MAEGIDLGDIVFKIIPVIISIAMSLVKGKSPAEISASEAAAIALFEALLAYLEVAL